MVAAETASKSGYKLDACLVPPAIAEANRYIWLGKATSKQSLHKRVFSPLSPVLVDSFLFPLLLHRISDV